MKRILNAVAVIAVAATAWNAVAADPVVSTAPKISDLFTNVIVAKGKGFEITRSQLDNEMIYARSSAAARGQYIAPEQMVTVEKQLLQQLIFLRILQSKATDADKAAGKESSDKQFSEMLEQVATNSTLANALDSRLKSVDLTRDQLHQQWTERAVADAVVRRELGIKITDSDVKAYYTNNPALFEQPEMVRVAHVLMMTRDMETGKEMTEVQKAERHKTMEDVLKRARSGESFSNLVMLYSEDPGSKSRGGEYTFARATNSPPGRGMVPEFEAAAFSLATNQISDIVVTMYGYHIVKLLEKMPSKKVELEKVADDVKGNLEQQAIMKLLPDFMKKAQKEAAVEILEADLKPNPLEMDIPDAPTPAPAPPK